MGNYVASPLSVLVLLSALLTSKGPKGETAKEICEAIVVKGKRETCSDLSYPNIEQMLNRIRTGVANSITEDGNKTLSLSNAIFLQKGLHVYQDFLTRFAKPNIDHVEEVRIHNMDPKSPSRHYSTHPKRLKALMTGHVLPRTTLLSSF